MSELYVRVLFAHQSCAFETDSIVVRTKAEPNIWDLRQSATVTLWLQITTEFLDAYMASEKLAIAERVLDELHLAIRRERSEQYALSCVAITALDSPEEVEGAPVAEPCCTVLRVIARVHFPNDSND